MTKILGLNKAFRFNDTWAIDEKHNGECMKLFGMTFKFAEQKISKTIDFFINSQTVSVEDVLFLFVVVKRKQTLLYCTLKTFNYKSY